MDSSDEMKTVRAEVKGRVVANPDSAILVHIYPTGPSMGTRYALGIHPLVIGRGEKADVHIDDPSVSRRHAVVQPANGQVVVLDLESTNGTFVNDHSVTTRQLQDGDYLRIGNSIFRFLTGGNVEAAYHEEIYRLTIIDALTDIHNKRFLLEFLDRESFRTIRHARCLSLVLFDIDHFKAVNDQRSHLCGDAVLRDLAALIKMDVRREDLLARFGGEEFAIALPETPLGEAVSLAERVRKRVEAHRFEFDGDTFPITISLGVATNVGDESKSVDDLIRAADDALYRAKGDGRNCTRSAEIPPTES